MGRSQETFNKKEVRNKKEKKRKEKLARKIARKDQPKRSSLEEMTAYIDEDGVITDTPPDPTKKKKEVSLESIQISTPKKGEEEAYDPVRKGIVTFFNDSKGYGFIKDSETKESIFVHVNNVLEEIKDNNVVTFEVEMGPKGASAKKVALWKEPPPKPVAPAKAEGEDAADDKKAEGDAPSASKDNPTKPAK